MGLVAPPSLGASIVWGSAQVLWLPARGEPRLLWSTPHHFFGLNDGYLIRRGHQLLVAENACWTIDVAPNRNPIVRHPTCANLLANTPGKRVSFRVAHQPLFHNPAHSCAGWECGGLLACQPRRRNRHQQGSISLTRRPAKSGNTRGNRPQRHDGHDRILVLDFSGRRHL